MSARLKWRGAVASFFATTASPRSWFPASAQAPSGQPITIGFGMALTGPLAANGKQALLGMKIWEEEINKPRAACSGARSSSSTTTTRPTPSTVPGIYTKLLDVDKVDLVLGPYATNMVGAGDAGRHAEGQGVHRILFGLDVNQRVQVSDKYFAMIPTGPDTKPSFTEGFFEVARRSRTPSRRRWRWSRPTPSSRAMPARARARTPRQHGLQGRLRQDLSAGDHRLLADRARDPGHQSGHRRRSAPIRSTRSAWSKAVNEIGFKPKMIGGAMVGLQATVFKNQLGPLLNGCVNYETWVPSTR